MRVLSWTQLFYPYIGGVEVHSLKLMQALRKRGHTVAAVTSHGALSLPDRDSVDGIDVHRFRFQEALSQRRLDLYAAERGRLSKVKEAFGADLVQVYFTDPSVLFHFQTQPQRPVPTVIGIQLPFRRAVAGPIPSRAGHCVRRPGLWRPPTPCWNTHAGLCRKSRLVRRSYTTASRCRPKRRNRWISKLQGSCASEDWSERRDLTEPWKPWSCCGKGFLQPGW